MKQHVYTPIPNRTVPTRPESQARASLQPSQWSLQPLLSPKLQGQKSQTAPDDIATDQDALCSLHSDGTILNIQLASFPLPTATLRLFCTPTNSFHVQSNTFLSSVSSRCH